MDMITSLCFSLDIKNKSTTGRQVSYYLNAVGCEIKIRNGSRKWMSECFDIRLSSNTRTHAFMHIHMAYHHLVFA